MRTSIFILAAFIAISSCTSCKTKKASSDAATSSTATTGSSNSSTSTTSTSTMSTSTTVTSETGKYNGKVSHKFKSTGCSSVIVFTGEDGNEMTLIPKDPLNKDIDTDGQTISFDYHVLRMPQPAGCSVGIPAEITNIVKLK